MSMFFGMFLFYCFWSFIFAALLHFPVSIITNEWRIKKISYQGNVSFCPQYKIIKKRKFHKDKEYWHYGRSEYQQISFKTLEEAKDYIKLEKKKYNSQYEEEIIEV